MLGNLTLDAIPHDPITRGGAAMVVLGALGALAAVTALGRWRWLWREWLCSVDHKRIGTVYILLALVMLLRGLGDAAMMRAQQALAVDACAGPLTPHHFNQIFTAHGVIMIFFVAMPFMFGLFNLVVPLQVGARDVAFPFLNSLGLWLTVAGAMLMNVSLVLGEFAATGWLAYPPLSENNYSPGVGVDYYIWALQLSGAGSLLSGINFLVTILAMRCPGMTLMRMPVFTWTALGSSLLILMAFPVLTVTLAMLCLDRLLGMHFFTSDLGGNAMVYVNMIWVWGHPEVYILVLPAFGVFSEVVATFSRKRLFGYPSMVWATMAITVLSFLVWLHHFFTMGAGGTVNAVFGIATMVIAIPTGVKVFNWLFTMFRGRVVLATPMLWLLGSLVLFTIGGMAGVMLSVPPADFQFHNSLFLVAHFHNTIIGGAVFGYLAGFAYWFPKVTGFRLDERLGKAAFWHWAVGFCLAFLPLYATGLMGMTRRLSHYDSASGWQPLMIAAAAGFLVIGGGVACLLAQIAYSVWKRAEFRDATGDPWDGRTLEWSIPSPPPPYNFAVTPVVDARDAHWEAKRRGRAAPPAAYEDIHLPPDTGVGVVVAGLAFLLAFSLVWRIDWLAVLCGAGVLAAFAFRSWNEGTGRIIPAGEVARLERAAGRAG